MQDGKLRNYLVDEVVSAPKIAVLIKCELATQSICLSNHQFSSQNFGAEKLHFLTLSLKLTENYVEMEIGRRRVVDSKLEPICHELWVNTHMNIGLQVLVLVDISFI